MCSHVLGNRSHFVPGRNVASNWTSRLILHASASPTEIRLGITPRPLDSLPAGAADFEVFPAGRLALGSELHVEASTHVEVGVPITHLDGAMFDGESVSLSY